MLGKPGVGKTTAIREIARVLADEMQKRVVIIDTSNEIAGDGDIPHPSIGRARRMQVSKPEKQHQVMIEAVENHMPEVIIIDEIGTELEAAAASTIAERGVQLVGTAHGNYLDSLIKNPILSDLIGGIEYITLGDDEAKRRGTQKSILERRASPVFQIAIEIHERYCWIIHENVEKSIDNTLQGGDLPIQKRVFNPIGETRIEYTQVSHISDFNVNANWKHFQFLSDKSNPRNSLFFNNNLADSQELNNNMNYQQDFNLSFQKKSKYLSIYPYGINLQIIDNLILLFNFPIITTRKIDNADFILGVRAHVKQNSQIRNVAKLKQIEIQTISSISMAQIVRALYCILNWQTYEIDLKKMSSLITKASNFNELEVFEEVRLAIEKLVIPRKITVELLPRNVYLRKIQHELIHHYQLKARSIGEEPNRKLRIYPN